MHGKFTVKTLVFTFTTGLFAVNSSVGSVLYSSSNN